MEKEFDPEDPLELVGVGLPEGNLEEMAQCLVEEYVRDGWDDESLLKLFQDPFYRMAHQIYKEAGEARILKLVQLARKKWGGFERGDAHSRLRLDGVKKAWLKEVKPDA
ncbi:MAG: hypothetical protein A3G41_04130 [Elusimicrobia bacterium RIFCSPLOWO2_12_FULL_59_9]|nr:MAG: hypothetical protein A3G41_04130 [Elusimicrobia bacterium RIFCSPLOWO2_12_FULL_59_9]